MIVGKHRLLSDCLHLLLESQFEVRSATAVMQQALALAAAFDPQIAIIDWPSPEGALDLGKRLGEAHPGLAITYICDEVHPRWSAQALSKACSTADLLHRIQSLLSSEPAGADDPYATSVGQNSDNVPTEVRLSRRELQVLILLVRGLRMKEVARILGISPRTVAFHKYRAMEANGLSNRAELLSFALQRGLFPQLSGGPFEGILPSAIRGLADTQLAADAYLTTFRRDRSRPIQ